MPAFAVSLLVGLLSGLWIETPGSAYSLMLLVIPGLLCWWLGGKAALALLCGFVFASTLGHEYKQRNGAEAAAAYEAVIKGVVADIPVVQQQGVSFSFDLYDENAAGSWPKRVRLSTYHLPVRPGAGEFWQFHVRLKPAHGMVNTGAFDRELWLFANNIHATGYIVDSKLNTRLPGVPSAYRMLRLRSRLNEKITSIAGYTPVAPILAGVTVGYRGGFTSGQWELFRKTGTSHLVAISGLHIGLVAFLMWHAGRLCTVLLRSCGFLMPDLLAPLSSVSGAVIYALLAGLAVSTFRAVLMLLLIVIALMRGRNGVAAGIFCMALLMVGCFQPLAVITPAFWLSFTAVAVLLTDRSNVIDKRHESGGAFVLYPLKLLRAQWVLMLGLAVPTGLIYNEIPLASPLANLLAVPLFSLVTVPSALAGLLLTVAEFDAADFFFAIAAESVEMLLSYLGWFINFPLLSPFQYVGGITGMMFCGVFLCVMLQVRSLISSCLWIMCLVGLLWLKSSPGGDYEIHVLDVGQGLAVIIRADHKTLIYDTGPSWPGGDAAQSQIIPALKRLGVADVETIIVSHGDNDHGGGLLSLIREFPNAHIIAAADMSLKGPGVTDCNKGLSWRWGKADFFILHPRDARSWSKNNASCVLQLTVDGFSVLLPGDIESEAEWVLQGRQELRPAQVVIAPHHGSRTSSSRLFIDAVDARQVIFTTGFLNRWKFPARDVLQRWRSAGACIFNTAVDGALLLSFVEGKGFSVTGSAGSSWLRPWPVRNSAPELCPEPL